MNSQHEESRNYLSKLRAGQPVSTIETNDSTQKLLPESRVIRLFARFQAKYTHRWMSAVDDDEVYGLAMADWREELSGITDADILVGLGRLPQSWPPTSGEFRALCKPSEQKSEKHNTAAYLPFVKQKQLEAPRNKSLAKSKLSEMRRILKGDRNIDVVANHG